ncbi:MAG: TetR/AcrR family transcriptional regulator [Clostridium sp.]
MGDIDINSEGNQISKKKKRIMIYFIEATEKLMEEEGIDSLSIRKIATVAGYNSATLYNYFEDLDHLILFASIRHLKKYVVDLYNSIKKEMDALETYRVIYRKFSEAAFTSPEIFYNMFFGHYSSKLSQVLRQYYELFPDELGEHKGFIRSMLNEGNIYQRDMTFMDALVEEGFVKAEKAADTVQVMVRTNESFILEACKLEDSTKIESHVEAFMKLFDYVMEAAK